MTILLVDDDFNDARLVREILVRQDPDLTIIDAETCEDALRMADTARIDCIVMDEKLVRTPGSECVERLRAQNYMGGFILLTGFPDTQTAVDAMSSGADNYLSKNDSEKGLYPAILKAVDKRRTLVRLQLEAEAKERRYQEESPIMALKTALEKLEVRVDSNNEKQYAMLLSMQEAQAADRRWRFRQWLILLTGLLTMLGKMFKDYLEAVYR